MTEISATSPKGFEHALQRGIDRTNKTLRHVTSAWIKEQQVDLEEGRIKDYQVNILVTFALDDNERG